MAKDGKMYDEDGRESEGTTPQTSSFYKGEKTSSKDVNKKELPRMANVGEAYSLTENEEPDLQDSKMHAETVVSQRQEDAAVPSAMCKKKLPRMAKVGEDYSLNENKEPDQVTKTQTETMIGQHQEATVVSSATSLLTDAGDSRNLERGRSPSVEDGLDRMLMAIEDPPDSSEEVTPPGMYQELDSDLDNISIEGAIEEVFVATVVQDDPPSVVIPPQLIPEADIFVATDSTVDNLKRKTVMFRLAIAASVVVAGVLAVSLWVTITGNNSNGIDESIPTSSPAPSMTSSPTTPQPTISESSLVQLIESRGWRTNFTASSPQSQALDWILSDSFSHAGLSNDRLIQRFALAALWYGIKSASWNRGGWLESADECSWTLLNSSSSQSLACNSNGLVVKLDLSFSDLEGAIPNELGLLTTLARLDLSGNHLVGTIFPAGLLQLTRLTDLSLADNMLSGTIPLTIPRLKELQELDLRMNMHEGTIPPQLGELEQLTMLNLWGGMLEGQIPDALFRLEKLEQMVLAKNQLTGSISTQVATLKQLKRLDLDHNSLTGSIPDNLFELPELTRLNLWGNSLTGQLPSTIGLSTRLRSFWLGNNDLTGSVPSEVAQLTELSVLSFSNNNRLGGELPFALGQLTKLTHLGLYSCNLSGTIPSELFSLTKLQMLELDLNGFTGSIPSELGHLTELVCLDFDENALTGSIPTTVGLLTKLTSVSFYNNMLSGVVPSFCGQLTHLEQLWVNINRLSGTIPTELSLLTELKLLSLDRNTLSGVIPTELGELNRLTSLVLYRNPLLKGSIPTELGELTELTWLQMTDNQPNLDGTIPSEIGRLTKLQEFELDSKLLITGTIPTEVGHMTQLTRLSLSGDALTGRIPSELGLLVKLQSMFLQDNTLTGVIPSQLATLTNLDFLWLFSNPNLIGSVPSVLCAKKPLRIDCDSSLECDCCNDVSGIDCPQPSSNIFEQRAP